MARKSEAVVAVVDNFDLSGLSEAAFRIKNAISWNNTDRQIDEYGDDDDEYCEDDVDWHIRGCVDELEESAYTKGTPTDDPDLPSASRIFQDARELLSRVESSRGCFPVVGIGAFDGVAQPSNDCKPAKSRGKGNKGRRKGKSSSQNGGQSTNFGIPGILPKPQTSRSESRPPMSKKRLTEVGATRGGPHHAPRLRPEQCMLCRQVEHLATMSQQRKNDCIFHLANGHLVPMLWAVQCSMPCVVVQLPEKPNKINTRMTSKTVLLSQSRVWRGLPFLMEKPRRPFLDS